MRLQEIILSIREEEFWNRGFANALAECRRCFAGAGRGFTRVYIVGCGTSCYAGLYGSHVIEKHAGIPCAVMEGNLGASFAWELVDSSTLFFGISNTGESETVCATMARAREAGAFTVAITGEAESPLARLCRELLYFSGSSDDVPTKTRSYLETLMMMLAVAVTLSDRAVELAGHFAAQVAQAGKAAGAVIDRGQAQMQPLAQALASCFSFTVAASGIHLANAYEASLKICEMGWMNSAAFETENYMHGRFRSSSPLCPYVLFAPVGEGYAKALDFLAVAHKKGAKTIVVTDAPTAPIDELAHAVIRMPGGLCEEVLPLLDILPLYQLGMFLGIAHGYEDPSLRHDGLKAQSTSLAALYPQYAGE